MNDAAANVRVCEACEMWRSGLRLGACLMLRDDMGRVSTDRLVDAVERGICPLGKFQALKIQNRLMEGR